MSSRSYDAVVVGSGPNGLATAVTMARAGRSVIVYEAASIAGGGTRSEELTLPGFVHDVCSAVHPMAVVSPFFRELELEKFGLEWVFPPYALAHPLDQKQSVMLEQSVEKTAANLGEDEGAYTRIMKPLQEEWEALIAEIFVPLVHPPRHPLLLARFGFKAILSAEEFSNRFFRGARARALFTGVAAHANCPLSRPGTAGIGLSLILAAHAKGWPIPKGGSQAIASALIAYLKSLGGEIETGREIVSLEQLPKSRYTFFDLTPASLPSILGERFSRSLARRYRDFARAPGVFKMDWCLSGPVPWQNTEMMKAGTIHLGGTQDELLKSERAPTAGSCPERPFILLSQPSLFDHSRAPDGGHTLWGYCHVPNGSSKDMSHVIESEIERLAPGFRSLIVRRSCLAPADLQAKNSNLVGGDISGGEFDLFNTISNQLLGFDPYTISEDDGFFICSSSTPPGPGVHGMCGYNAANLALSL